MEPNFACNILLTKALYFNGDNYDDNCKDNCRDIY